MPLELHVQACMQDRCQCPHGTSCVCSTIAEFSRQCSHAGGRPRNWRTASLCRKCRAARSQGHVGRDPRGARCPLRSGPGAMLCPAQSGREAGTDPSWRPLRSDPRLRALPLPVQLRAALGTWFTWRAARPAWTPAHTWRSAACVRNIAWTAVSARKVSAGDARRQRSGERCPEVPPATCAWWDGRLAAWASALSRAEGE